MSRDRTLNRLAITHPAVRFFVHNQSLREQYETTVRWVRNGKARCLALGYRKYRPDQFRLRFTDGRFWWDFK
jgi:hypothetical protein